MQAEKQDKEAIFDTQKIDAQLQKWREKLIDLTKSNPLLRINHSRVSKLQANEPSLTTLFKMLAENLNSIDFDRVIYCEITPKGAMGNEGGILMYVLKDEDTLITYETNIEVDVQAFNAVSERISQNAHLFINYYGGMGNYVCVKKNAQLEIDEKYNCFWYHSQNTKLRIDSSVQGVFLSVVADMTGQNSDKDPDKQ